jgi:hypothetical protein
MCNKCVVYVNYITSDIPNNVINEFNNKIGNSEDSFINDKNIDNFRSNPLLINLTKKYDNNFKIKKVLNNQLINFNEKIKFNNYQDMLLYLLDEWSNCECCVNNKTPIHVLMNFKFVLKYLEELNVIPSDVCNKLKKILRNKLHIKDQIIKLRETIFCFLSIT